jgi:hypothetical protein
MSRTVRFVVVNSIRTLAVSAGEIKIFGALNVPVRVFSTSHAFFPGRLRPVLIAEEFLDVKGSTAKIVVRVFAPEQEDDGVWVCRFEVGEPIRRQLNVNGESSLQALALALFALSIDLYNSDEYREGRLGVEGRFGGTLGIPAPTDYLVIDPGEKKGKA